MSDIPTSAEVERIDTRLPTSPAIDAQEAGIAELVAILERTRSDDAHLNTLRTELAHYRSGRAAQHAATRKAVLEEVRAKLLGGGYRNDVIAWLDTQLAGGDE